MAVKRLLYIDFFRFGAIFLMFWDHAIKFFYDSRPLTEATLFFNFIASKILGLTSLSSAIFLFLVGYCLGLSFERYRLKDKSSWFVKKFKRGLWLIFLSYLLFFFRMGSAIPATPTTTGILQLIGTAVILGSWFYYFPRAARWGMLIFFNLLVLMLDFSLRAKGIAIPLLNTELFPLLPSVSYVFTGMLVAEGFFSIRAVQKKKVFYQWLLAASSVGTLLFLIVFNFNLFQIFQLRHHVGDYWQPSLTLMAFNTLICLGLFAYLALMENQLKKVNLVRKLGMLGQKALAIYFFHFGLAILFARYLLKGAKFGYEVVFLAVVGFMLVGWGWVKLRGVTDNY
jgi:hypothetical protein